MSAALLGLRLALTPASRMRTAVGAGATALGTLAMVLVAAIARGEMAVFHAAISGEELSRLVLAVVLAVSLPLVALIATVARLSASIRDQRLANLRLIGLTPMQTRVVATAEAAVASVTGLVIGLLGYVLATGVLEPLQRARALDIALVCVAVPGLSILLSVLPAGGKAASALERARRADRRPPSLLRAVPLVIGVAVCGYVIVQAHQTTYAEGDIAVIFAGIVITGIGLLLVVPVFVRLLALLVGRIWHGPAATVASRRLQAQPAGVARVVSALLIGLFVVTGARYVVAAFESVPQYRAADHAVNGAQSLAISARLGKTPAVSARAQSAEGVRDVLVVPTLRAACHGCGVTALVMTCADLVSMAPEATGCRDDEPTWLWDNGDHLASESGFAERVTWHPGKPRTTDPVVTTSGRMPSLDPYPGGESIGDLLPIWGDVIIPPRLVAELPARTRTEVVVLAGPGRDLTEHLDAVGLGSYYVPYDFEFYDMVRGLRLLAAAVAGFILAVGLLAFAVAAIDRAIVRRRELVGLRLLGVPGSLLRRTQWLEALLPIGVGSVLAVGLGALAGATYLTLNGDDVIRMPWAATGTIAAAAAVGSVVVAGLTVIASNRPIRAEMIRTE